MLPLRALTTTSYSTPFAGSEENFDQEFFSNSTYFTTSEDASTGSENTSLEEFEISKVFVEQSFNMTSRSSGMQQLN